MNYQRIYDEIISNAKSRGLNKKLLNGYFEKHHIIPRCINGTNDKDNLVLLTAREHYICHYLLWKIHKDDNKLFMAYHKMLHSKNKKQKRFNAKLTSKEFNNVREFHCIIARERMLGRKLSDETKQKMKGRVGWMKGRKHSDEMKAKLKIARNKRVITPETRAKMNAAHLRNKLKRLEVNCV